MAKKIITIFTALFVMLSILPTGVMAEEVSEEIPEETVNENVNSEESILKEAETEGTEETRSSDGFGNAVLTDEGELIFFRSTTSYENASTGTFTDIAGNNYTGTVYSQVEKWVPTSPIEIWYKKRTEIKSVRVADGQTVKPIAMRD